MNQKAAWGALATAAFTYFSIHLFEKVCSPNECDKCKHQAAQKQAPFSLFSMFDHKTAPQDKVVADVIHGGCHSDWETCVNPPKLDEEQAEQATEPGKVEGEPEKLAE